MLLEHVRCYLTRPRPQNWTPEQRAWCVQIYFESRSYAKIMAEFGHKFGTDLSPLDFYLWGYLKDRVYQEKPKDLRQLKQKIRKEIGEIQIKVLKDVMQNFTIRLNKCINAQGGHLEHML